MNQTAETAPIPLLEVEGLKKYFPVKEGFFSGKKHLRAVDGVSFRIREGETFGLVGESGCGKTTTGRLILRLIESTSGTIRFLGRDVMDLDRRGLKDFRKNTQIIFQDPFTSLDPRMTVEDILEEPFKIQQVGDRRQRRKRIEEMLDVVGLGIRFLDHYPHEFSGGQRQRIGIARALALRPRFIVCDEPVSALDVSVQSQILNLLSDLQEAYGLTYLFISHNLNVVNYISHQVGVMYLGKIVEVAESETLYRSPIHPYTRALLAAIPVPDPDAEEPAETLAGEIASLPDGSRGCRFFSRCPERKDGMCDVIEPHPVQVAESHTVACHLAGGAERNIAK